MQEISEQEDLECFIQKLSDIGVNIENVKEVMCNDFNVYKDVLISFMEDKSFNNLNNAINKKDYKEAFLIAHTLKGILSNLCIDNMQKKCSEIVEKLRYNDYDNINQLIENLEKEYNRVIKFIIENCE